MSCRWVVESRMRGVELVGSDHVHIDMSIELADEVLGIMMQSACYSMLTLLSENDRAG